MCVVGECPDGEWFAGAFLLVGSLGGDFGCGWAIVFGFVELFVKELELFGGVCEVFLVCGHVSSSGVGFRLEV